MQYKKYDATKYNFAEHLKNKFGQTLEDLHNVTEDSNVIADLKSQQHTKWHKIYYNNIRKSDFLRMYREFVAEYVKPCFGDKQIVYQKVPTFRIQYPHNTAVAEFHKDSDYAHSKKEVNFFIPLTECKDTNAIWVETELGSENYKPMQSSFGEFVMWDGANLKHGNKVSEETWTRVSFDFRVLTLEDYYDHEKDVLENNKQSVVGGVPMLLGEYYDKL